MMKTKLAHAVAMTLAGGALSLGAVSTASATSSTMYNMFKTSAASQTDGWVYGFNSTLAQGTRGGTYANPIAPVNFVGTASATTTPFGYQGSSHLNWAVQLGAVGDTAQISAADSAQYSTANNYNGAAEIDTGAGAWMDDGTSAQAGTLGETGWKHQTDIGLIKSNADQYVTLKLSSLGTVNGNFGVTIFTGMDTNTGNYSHHGAWNSNATPSTGNNPFGTQGVNFLTYDATVDSTNGITFLALANQVYSIYLGGNGVGAWAANVAGYQMNITTAPVPVPAAAWLFGGALMSLFGANRRKKVLPA